MLLVWAQVPVPLQASSVQTLLSVAQAVAAAAKQLSAVSLQELLQSAPPAQGSPAWPQVPAPQVSAPLQKTPSSQGAVLLVWAQAPAPLQKSSVQTLLSVAQAVAVELKQLSAASLQELLHAAPAVQGSPTCVVQAPAVQLSAPLQNVPSSQAVPLLTLMVQRAWPTPALAGFGSHCLHWLPPVHEIVAVGVPQTPAWQVSPDVQALPSLQAVPFASCTKVPSACQTLQPSRVTGLATAPV